MIEPVTIEGKYGARVKVSRVDDEVALGNSTADLHLIVPIVLDTTKAREVAAAILAVADEISPSPIDHAKQLCVCGHPRVGHNQIDGACNQCGCYGFEP